LPPGTRPGLRDAVETLAGVSGIEFVHFGAEDVVRPPLVARIIRAYDAAEIPENTGQ
jgi:phosphate starvation-inducible PhoH-like protein